jgi:hypothetical protein
MGRRGDDHRFRNPFASTVLSRFHHSAFEEIVCLAHPFWVCSFDFIVGFTHAHMPLLILETKDKGTYFFSTAD